MFSVAEGGRHRPLGRKLGGMFAWAARRLGLRADDPGHQAAIIDATVDLVVALFKEGEEAS